MSTDHYVDSNGNYVGGYGDGAVVPEGYTLVPSAPPSAFHTWVTDTWVAPEVTLGELAIEAQRRVDAVADQTTKDSLQMEAILLMKKGELLWDADDQASWDAGLAVAMAIKTIRTKQAEIAAMNPIPQDYATNEAYWI